MNVPAEAAALVLIGGASSRMGTDKASLVVDGVSLLDRVLAAIGAAGISQVAIVGGNQVPDAEPHAGPLAGIVGGWRHLRHRSAADMQPDPVVVLSCDLPELTAAVVQRLVEESMSHRHGALAHDGERAQPLVAAYRANALDSFEVAFDSGERSPRRCFDGWDLAIVPIEAATIADADTPSDLRAFDVEWPS